MLQLPYNIYLFLLTQSMSKSFIFPTKAYTNELCDLNIICWFSITHFDSYPTFQGPVSSAQWYSGQWQQKDASNFHKYEQIVMNLKVGLQVVSCLIDMVSQVLPVAGKYDKGNI